ncbi:MAG: histidine phosphatase family protein [Chloroflexota bacterium]
MSRRLILVRHGITDWNREGRFQGHADPPLSEDGRSEATLLGQRLAADERYRPRRIVASSLARALETAELIGAALAAAGSPTTVEPDARLMEVGQGEWEGRTHAELAVDDPKRYAAWRAHSGDDQPPGAEPIEAVLARARATLDEALPVPDAWPLCLVSHGGTLRLLARDLLGLSPRRAWALDLDNGSLSVLAAESEEGWGLERWNDCRHLLGRIGTHADESEGEPLAL